MDAGVAMAGWLEQQVLCYLLPLPWDFEKVCVHYLKAVSVSYTLPGLLIVSRAGFQTPLRALIFPVLVPRAGLFNVELKSLAPLREPPSL